ncbi:MAG: DUF4394 domain-containing protein [Phycisphaerales bacterium]
MKKMSLVLAAGALFAAAGSAVASHRVYGVTFDQRLVTFAPNAPGVFLTDTVITGLAPDETILGIDARPRTGGLVIMTNGNRLMSVDAVTAAATAIGAGFAPALSGATEFGMDFNPTVDRIRVVDNLGGNRRLNPVTGGAVATDTGLTSGGMSIGANGTAYRNWQFLLGVNAPNFSVRQYVVIGSGTSFGLGEVGSMVGGNASFNGGVVTAIGGGFAAPSTDNIGFDIFGPLDEAYVSLTDTTSFASSFYGLDLGTGGLNNLGIVGSGSVRDSLIDFTVLPTPGAAGLLGLGGLLVARRRR